HALIPELSWAAAFVLGAIVAPTDIAAARAVLERLGLPRLLLTLLEGEGLLNDATAVITYRAAVAAVAVGAFSLDQVGLSIVLVGAGGLAYGVVLGYVIARIRTPIEDAPIEITISLLTPYVVYLTAEAIGVSGIVATVATGIFLGRRSSTIMSPSTRIAGLAVWQLFIFVLNSALFMLVGQGLTLPLVMRVLGVAADDSEDAEEQQAREVTGDAALRRIGELEKEWPTHRPLIEQLRTQYEHRAEHRDRREADATAADQE